MLAVDDEVGRIIEKLKARGLTSPYLRPFVVVAHQPNPVLDVHRVRFRRRARSQLKNTGKFKVERIKQEDVVRAGGGGPPDEAEE